MGELVFVHEHARKHGLRDTEIIYAWMNYFESAQREATGSELRIGFTPSGKSVQMLGVRIEDGWLVFHAMSPVTKKVLREIEAAKGHPWRNTRC